MKYKLFTLLVASFTMVACGPKESEAASKENNTSETATAEAPTSAVGKGLAPVVQKFNGEKYTPTQVAGNPDYYILYFTASW